MHAIYRQLICCFLFLLSPLLWAQQSLELQVFKNPNCGCCGKWVEHVNEAGFNSQVIEQQNMGELKAQLGIAPQYQSCHVASNGKYVFEGHVPATEMKRFLAAPPEGAIGLAVPGMPIGSPGMEMDNRHQDYNVLLLKEDGSSEIFAEIRH